MSMIAARQYFRTRAANLGLKEWKDGFSFQTLPANIYDKAFHIESGPYAGQKLNQLDQEMTAQVNVRIFHKGFRDPSSAIDSLVNLSETFIKDCIVPRNRLSGNDGIINVVFENMAIEPVGDSNDSAMFSNIQFRVVLVLNFN